MNNTTKETTNDTTKNLDSYDLSEDFKTFYHAKTSELVDKNVNNFETSLEEGLGNDPAKNNIKKVASIFKEIAEKHFKNNFLANLKQYANEYIDIQLDLYTDGKIDSKELKHRIKNLNTFINAPVISYEP